MIRGTILGILAMTLCAAIPASTQAAPAHPPAAASTASIPQTPQHLALADTLVAVAKVNEQQMKAVPQIVEMLMPMMVRGNETQSNEVRTILSEEFGKIFVAHQQDMVRVSRDAFARHLTDQQLRDVTAFYRTPTGQRLIEVQPMITAESMSEGQDIGRRAAMDAMPSIIERMRKAHLKVPDRT